MGTRIFNSLSTRNIKQKRGQSRKAMEYANNLPFKLDVYQQHHKNKKVLLRERKRHTIRHVASAHYVGWGGYPIQSWWGVPGVPPHPDLAWGVLQVPPIQTWLDGVSPHHDRMEYPPPSRPGQGVPWVLPHHPDLAGVTLLPSRPYQGYPRYPTHHPDLARVPPHHPDLARVPPSPPSRPGWGTPHHPDLAGIPPHHPDLARVPLIQTWLGYPPHHPDLAWYLPPPIQTWPVYPPLRGVDWQTNWKQYLPPSFGCGR